MCSSCGRQRPVVLMITSEEKAGVVKRGRIGYPINGHIMTMVTTAGDE